MEEKKSKPQSFMLQSLPACLFVGWVLLMGLPPFALWMLRTSWLEDLGRPNVQAEWNEFRDDMKKQSDRSGLYNIKYRRVRSHLYEYGFEIIFGWRLPRGGFSVQHFMVFLVSQ